MNNHRLLTGLLSAALLSGGVCCFGQVSQALTLEDLFEIAETHSVQLHSSFSAEEEAGREINVSKSGRLPDISASLSFSYIGDGFTTERNLTDYQRAPIPHFGSGLALKVSQPVYTGGALTAAIEMSELKLTAARYATELKRDNIRFTLTGYYLDIYRFGNLRTVVENNIIQARKMLDEMKARFEQGTVLQNDITRYELLVSNLELQLIKINNTLAILNRSLSVTAGIKEDTVIQPDSTLLTRSLPKENVNWWKSQAEENAPALRLARSGVDLCRKAEEIARSDYLPKIGVQAGWTIDGPILVEVPPINRNLSYWYVGVGVSYNLSSLYKTNKTVSKTKAATIHALDTYNAACENTGLAVNSDYTRYMEAYEELKNQEKSVELAECNYHITATRYSADMALITDLLDAANSKLEAERQLVNARINIIYCYYKLLFTSGKI